MSEMERLKKLFRDKQAKGLIDMKFFVFGNGSSPEEIAASANQMDDLVAEGDVVRHREWPKTAQRDISGLLH